jgi:hypothetical protein
MEMKKDRLQVPKQTKARANQPSELYYNGSKYARHVGYDLPSDHLLNGLWGIEGAIVGSPANCSFRGLELYRVDIV